MGIMSTSVIGNGLETAIQFSPVNDVLLEVKVRQRLEAAYSGHSRNLNKHETE